MWQLRNTRELKMVLDTLMSKLIISKEYEVSEVKYVYIEMGSLFSGRQSMSGTKDRRTYIPRDVKALSVLDFNNG